jgi:hypothetical protein
VAGMFICRTYSSEWADMGRLLRTARVVATFQALYQAIVLVDFLMKLNRSMQFF